MRWLLAAILGVSGCGPHPIRESTDVSTRDISIAIEVKNEGGPTRVTAGANGKLPYTGALTLGPGDRFVLRGEHESDSVTPLVRDPNQDTKYVAETERTSGTFVVDLLRAGDAPIPNNAVAIPPPFDLTGPSGVLRRSDRITLKWQAASGTHQTTVRASGSCTSGLLLQLHVDTGEYVINGGEIPGPKSGTFEECDVTITVTRTAPRSSTPTSYGLASQSRSLIVRLTP